jgi:Glycosyl hydrolase family 3 C-terminal domain/Fibronectin type III-like domain/PA14 domain
MRRATLRIASFGLHVLAAGAATAQPVAVTIDAARTAPPITPLVFGGFMEPATTRVWAEMLYDRKFFNRVTSQPDPAAPQGGFGRRGPLRRWLPVGPDAFVEMDRSNAYVGEWSPRVRLEAASPHGLSQSGLALRAGRAYTGRVTLAGSPGARVSISLVWGPNPGDRQTVRAPALGAGFVEVPLRFTAQADTGDGNLEIIGTGSGSFRVGAASLMPADNVSGFKAVTIRYLKELGIEIARWPGFLTSPESGTYRLGVEGFGNRLFLDDKKLVDQTGGFPPPPSVVDVPLEKGRRYAIRIESVPRRFASTRLVWTPPQPDVEARAVAAAREADVVVAVVGITSDLEGEESGVQQEGFKGGDRTSLDLPREEQRLLEAVKAGGKPLVVVVMSGSAIALNWAKQNANAILQAWYPGVEGGTAIAQTLDGTNNQSGRLPITLYTGVDQLPEFTDYSMARRTYRYFDGEPLFPFGFGLGYSTFAYSDLKLKATLAAGDPLRVEAQVRNAGTREGDEVVQVYLTFPRLPGAPLRALRGFARVHLKPGEQQAVAFTLNDRELSHVSLDGMHAVRAGRYGISVGGGQPGAGAPVVMGTSTFRASGRCPGEANRTRRSDARR